MRDMSKTPRQLDAEIQDADARCTTCMRPVASPHRRNDARGVTVEGCIDAAHDGHLYGESLRWHNRPAAKKFRAEMKARRKALLKGK
jgi:hypothetical protein